MSRLITSICIINDHSSCSPQTHVCLAAYIFRLQPCSLHDAWPAEPKHTARHTPSFYILPVAELSKCEKIQRTKSFTVLRAILVRCCLVVQRVGQQSSGCDFFQFPKSCPSQSYTIGFPHPHERHLNETVESISASSSSIYCGPVFQKRDRNWVRSSDLQLFALLWEANAVTSQKCTRVGDAQLCFFTSYKSHRDWE